MTKLPAQNMLQGDIEDYLNRNNVATPYLTREVSRGI